MPYTDLVKDHVVIAGISEYANKLANRLSQQVNTLHDYTEPEVMKFNVQSLKILTKSVITTENLHQYLQQTIKSSGCENDPEWQRLNKEAIDVISITLEWLSKRKRELMEGKE